MVGEMIRAIDHFPPLPSLNNKNIPIQTVACLFKFPGTEFPGQTWNIEEQAREAKILPRPHNPFGD